MACQGCGRTSQTRLCCPTCIELGRTSFFCGQECFTKNWAAHNQLHELLKRKKALAEEISGASSTTSGASSTSTQPSTAHRPRPSASGTSTRPEESASAAPQRTFAPLPGGQPLTFLNRAPAAAAAAAKKSDDAVTKAAAETGSMLSSFFEQAKAALEGVSGAASTTKPRSHESERQGAHARPAGIRIRAESPARQGTSASAPGHSRIFTAQTILWILVALTALGTLVIFKMRVSEEHSSSTGSLGTLRGAATLLPLQAVAGLSGSTPGTMHSIESLKEDIADLADLVKRHDKMLKYIMERFVEKEEKHPEKGSPGVKPLGEHEALVVNLSAPEFVSMSEPDSAAGRAGDTLRKRRGGGDTSMVGLPEPEAKPV